MIPLPRAGALWLLAAVATYARQQDAFSTTLNFYRNILGSLPAC